MKDYNKMAYCGLFCGACRMDGMIINATIAENR